MSKQTLPLSEIAVPSPFASARSNSSKQQSNRMVLDRWLVKPETVEDSERDENENVSNSGRTKERVVPGLASPKQKCVGSSDAIIPGSVLKKTPHSQNRSALSSVKRWKKPGTPVSTKVEKEGPKSTGLFKFFKPVEGSASSRRRSSVSVIIEPSPKKLKDNRGLSALVGQSTPTPLSRSQNILADEVDDDVIIVETMPAKKVFKQCCLSFAPAATNMDQNKETPNNDGQSTDAAGLVLAQTKPRFEFTFDTKTKRSTIMDDLDDRILVTSNPLPELTLLEPFKLGSDHFAMPKLANLAMVHEFIHVFSGELFDFAFVSPEGDPLSLDCLEKMIKDQEGFHAALANLHCALLRYVYEDGESDPPNIDATNFQYYLAETLKDTEYHTLLGTREYPLLSPDDRLNILSRLLEKVLWTRTFSQHMKELNLRRVEMSKEKQKRKDSRRDLEIDVGDMERGCEELEREIEEVEKNENGEFLDADAKIQSDDDESQDSKNEDSKCRITSRQATLERAKVRAEIAEQFRERRAVLAKQLAKRRKNLKEKQMELEELDEREKGYDAEKETLSAQMRGGAVVGQSICTSELVHLGYDRWARGYWHWRSVGGIFVEDHDEDHGLKISKKDRKTSAPNSLESTDAENPVLCANPNSTDEIVSSNLSLPTTQTIATNSSESTGAKKSRKWWCIRNAATFRELVRVLNPRGSRERTLKANISQIRSEIEKTFPKFSEWLDRRQVVAVVDPSGTATPLSPSSLTQTTLPIFGTSVASKIIDPQRLPFEKYVEEFSSAVREKISRLHRMADEYGGYELEQLCDSELPPVPTVDVQDASSLARHLRSVIARMSNFPGATTGNPLGLLREKNNEIGEEKCKMGTLAAINVWLHDLLESMEKIDREKRLREEEEARKERKKALRTKAFKNNKGKGKESTSNECAEEEEASTSRKTRRGNGRNSSIQEEPARKRPMRAAAVLAVERTRLTRTRKVNYEEEGEEDEETTTRGRTRKMGSEETNNAEDDESFENPGSSSEPDGVVDELADTYEVDSEEEFTTRRLRERPAEQPPLSRAERAAARMEQKERKESEEAKQDDSEGSTALLSPSITYLTS